MASFFQKIPRTVLTVGVVSFLINTSTLMIFSIFGIYLHKELNINFSMIGFLDGAVEFSSCIMKMLSGVLSDFLKNRKLLFLIGSVFLFIAKPLEAIATNYWTLFQAKILERIGNGIQSTPRDAIVGDWAPKDKKATCFGLRQSLAAFGSVIGAILSSFLLKESGGNYQFVFWMAAIPSFCAIMLIVFFVKDKNDNQFGSKFSFAFTTKKASKQGVSHSKYRKISFRDAKLLGARYWILIGVACTYMVSKVSESIVIWHVTDSLGLSEYMAPLCMIFYQLANTCIAFPAGIISDKIKVRENVFITGIIVFLISDVLFIFGNSLIVMALGLVFLGMYTGVTQSVFPAKIVEVVPPDLKGTALGIFNLACALSFIVGGSLAGVIAETYTPRHSFIVSSGLATLSLIVLFISKEVSQKLEKSHDNENSF